MSNHWFVKRTLCPACASDNFKIRYNAPYDQAPIKDYLNAFYGSQGKIEPEYLADASYVLCECANCRLIFQRDIPNDLLMVRLYEHWIDPQKVFILNQEQEDLAYYSKYAQEIMQIMAYLNKKPLSLSFLDFGMGWGKWALMAKAFGCDSFGMELSKERIEHAKSNGIKVIHWNEVPQQSFDFINTEQVFEHIPNPLQTLQHLCSGLKKGGILKISVPTANGMHRRLKLMDWNAPKDTRNSLNAVAPLEHINYFRRRSISEMAVQTGLKEVLIPLKTQYQYVTDWHGMNKVMKNIFLPIYINIFQKRNYVFLKKI